MAHAAVGILDCFPDLNAQDRKLLGEIIAAKRERAIHALGYELRDATQGAVFTLLDCCWQALNRSDEVEGLDEVARLCQDLTMVIVSCHMQCVSVCCNCMKSRDKVLSQLMNAFVSGTGPAYRLACTLLKEECVYPCLKRELDVKLLWPFIVTGSATEGLDRLCFAVSLFQEHQDSMQCISAIFDHIISLLEVDSEAACRLLRNMHHLRPSEENVNHALAVVDRLDNQGEALLALSHNRFVWGIEQFGVKVYQCLCDDHREIQQAAIRVAANIPADCVKAHVYLIAKLFSLVHLLELPQTVSVGEAALGALGEILSRCCAQDVNTSMTILLMGRMGEIESDAAEPLRITIRSLLQKSSLI